MLDVNLTHILQGHQNPIYTIAYAGNNRLFSAGNDKGVVEWDLQEGVFKRILCAVSHSVYALHHLPGSTNLAIGLRSGEILIVDIEQQRLVKQLMFDKGAVFALRTVPEKSEMIAVGEDGVAYVYDTVLFKLLYRFRVSDQTVRTIEFSADGTQVYFGDKQGILYHYQTTDYSAINQARVHSMPVTSLLCFDGQLYSGGRDAKMYQLDAATLDISLETTPHLFTVYGMVSLEQGPMIVTASRDKSWKIWDAKSLRLLKNVSKDKGYDSHHLSINALLYAGGKVITAGDDKTVRVWNVAVSA